MGLEEKGADDIIGSADESLGFSILRRSVWAGETVGNAVGGEEGTKGRVDELTAIVTLHAFNHCA